MSTVVIRPASYEYEYEYGELKKTIFGIMESHAVDLIQKGSRVIIKPNLLAPASPEKAIVTHPLVIKAVVEYVLQRFREAELLRFPTVRLLLQVHLKKLSQKAVSRVLSRDCPLTTRNSKTLYQ
jgi:uncharacterized protein (DUF362 family)